MELGRAGLDWGGWPRGKTTSEGVMHKMLLSMLLQIIAHKSILIRRWTKHGVAIWSSFTAAHLFLLEVDSREELFRSLVRLLLVVGAVVVPLVLEEGETTRPPDLIGHLLERLVVNATSQQVGGQLIPDHFSELHARAGELETDEASFFFLITSFFLFFLDLFFLISLFLTACFIFQ